MPQVRYVYNQLNAKKANQLLVNITFCGMNSIHPSTARQTDEQIINTLQQ